MNDWLRVFVTDPTYHEERVESFLRTTEQADPAQARLLHARRHGARDWPSFLAYLQALASGHAREPFLEAFEAMKQGAWDRLSDLLERQPDLARARGTNGNTMLNLGISLAGSTCAPLPLAAEKLLDKLFRAGDVNEANDRGWTPLHQAAYANAGTLVERLLAAGADPSREAYGEGGTPLAVALFWGHREAGDGLGARAVAPDNLRIVAGLGKLDLVLRCFTPDGALTEAARSKRGFYRPHTGFPPWKPSPAPQEVLDEALVWAAKADRVEVLPELVARGADVNADPYRGTPLAWAAANGRWAAASWLVDHGAAVNRTGTFGGLTHGERVTALHLAAQADHAEVVRLLLERGADPHLRDALYGGTPAGWAEHAGSARALALLGERG
ncbi:MAG TPA: ankyrin repeat domain-containing protein [Candidatus Polarisedimenticolaceae bacterium]|nr:ankyrin repeat domain-containing protein [Candidatus Polarisedimenticolaceae bacterium]